MAGLPINKYSPFVVESVNVSGLNGEYAAYDSKNSTFSAAKTGYKPLGIVAWGKEGTGSSNVVMTGSFLNTSSNNMNVTFKNTLNSSVTVSNAYVQILYQPIG